MVIVVMLVKDNVFEIVNIFFFLLVILWVKIIIG